MITRIVNSKGIFYRNRPVTDDLIWSGSTDLSNKTWKTKLQDHSIDTIMELYAKDVAIMPVLEFEVYTKHFNSEIKNRLINPEELYHRKNLFTLFQRIDNRLILMTVRGKTLEEYLKIGTDSYNNCMLPIIIYKKDDCWKACNGINL